MKLNIVGGTYYEICIEPDSHFLYGSGMRAVGALNGKGFDISFHSCAADDDNLDYLKCVFDFEDNIKRIPKTIAWEYYHPLSPPKARHFHSADGFYTLPVISSENILYYGMHETRAKVEANYLVYDPQNHIALSQTGSTFNHLALILNKNEALLLSGEISEDLVEVGQSLLKSENADVVVIKNGANGALVFEGSNFREVPVFKTNKVWPIGSGDIFSAAFAWHWMMKKVPAFEAAFEASKLVAQYCESQHLPLLDNYRDLTPLTPKIVNRTVYLAGPFFTFGERFLINEIHDTLELFGHTVFSPLHDGRLLDSFFSDSETKEVVEEDLLWIDKCDTLFAVISGTDPGTLFEVGYAVSKGKHIVVFSENVSKSDLVMIIGSDIEVIDDFSTAIYKVSWE